MFVRIIVDYLYLKRFLPVGHWMVMHKKARPVQSVLTQSHTGDLLESNGVGHYKSRDNGPYAGLIA